MVSESVPPARRVPFTWRRVLGTAVPLGVLAAVLGVLIGLMPWIQLLPRSQRRQLTEGLLRAALFGYAVVLAVAVVGSIALAVVVYRAWRRRARRPIAARMLLGCVSTFVGLVLAEASAAVWQAWAHRMPALPNHFDKHEDDNAFHIVVIGGSSARGDPYNPWMSVGQIAAWALEQARPERAVSVDVAAEAGVALETMHQKLARLTRKPDALVIYAGHNEFQARFDWQRNVWLDEAPASRWLERAYRVSLVSPLCRTLYETITKYRLDGPPPLINRHSLIDPPACSPSEYAAVLDDFHRRLVAIVSYCERMGIVPILIIPPSNESGFEPNRSSLPASVSDAERVRVAATFHEARRLEDDDAEQAETLYRHLVARYPTFAEAHFRLGRLLERDGRFSDAAHHFNRARDLDTFPQRCQGPFQEAFRRVAARHSQAILIDGLAELRAISPHGILDDHLFHDAQHPTLRGHVALAQAVVRALWDHPAFGRPSDDDTAAPVIDPIACAEHFGMDAEKWSLLCRRVHWFYDVTSKIRHDPTERRAKADRYLEAAEQIARGLPPEAAGIIGLGLGRHGEDRLGRTAPDRSEQRIDERRRTGARQGHQHAERPQDQQDREQPPLLVVLEEVEHVGHQARLRPLPELLQAGSGFGARRRLVPLQLGD